MFHYRWNFKDDIENASTRLPLLHDMSLAEHNHREFKNFIADWQTNRLWVVGSNEITAPIIEASYKRFLEQLEELLALQPFLFGSRPSSADYGIYGQLTQLIGFDPTSRAIAYDRSPRVISWLDLMEDMSGLEPEETDWFSLENVLENFGPIFQEIGRVYIPALLSNAQGVANNTESWKTQIDEAIWEQKCFPYQAKCFKWINDEFNALNDDDQNQRINFIGNWSDDGMNGHFIYINESETLSLVYKNDSLVDYKTTYLAFSGSKVDDSLIDQDMFSEYMNSYGKGDPPVRRKAKSVPRIKRIN